MGEPESIPIGERQFQLIEAGDFGRSESLSIQLGGLPRASAADRFSNGFSSIRFEYAAPAALGVLMTVLLAYGFFWKGRHTRERPQQAPEEAPPDQ